MTTIKETVIIIARSLAAGAVIVGLLIPIGILFPLYMTLLLSFPNLSNNFLATVISPVVTILLCVGLVYETSLKAMNMAEYIVNETYRIYGEFRQDEQGSTS